MSRLKELEQENQFLREALVLFSQRIAQMRGKCECQSIIIATNQAKPFPNQRGLNVSAGLRKAQANGKHIGRPKLKEEYKAKIIQLREEGGTIRGIAKKLKIAPWSVFRSIKEHEQAQAQNRHQ